MLTLFFMFFFAELMMKCLLFHPAYNFQIADVLNGHGAELKVELISDNLYQIMPNKKLGINIFGFRDNDFSTDKRGMKRVCFLGDSFTMGLNVKTQETMPKILEKQLKGYQVYNMGVVGFGPDQELNVLQKYGFKFKPDWVVEGICALNDSGDIYKDQIYESNLNTGQLQLSLTNPVKSLVFASAFSIVNQINFLKNRDHILGILDPLLFGDTYDLTWMKYPDSDESKYKYSLMYAILKKMKDELAQRKINYVVVIIPSYDNMCNDKYFKDNNVDPGSYFANEKVYQNILDRGQIPSINLVPYFMSLDKDQRCSLFDAGNGHLSPAGNWFSAQIIALYINSFNPKSS